MKINLTLTLPVVLACLHLLAPRAQAKLNVVATTPDLAALAQSVGGDQISLTTLAKPTEDPHTVDARPSFIVKLNHADALIEGGVELEIGWLPPLLDGARNPKVAPGAPGRIVCGASLELLEVPATLDRSRGDVHALGNPHFLVDPLNAKIVAGHICDSFCQLDRPNSEFFRKNLAGFSRRLDEKLAGWRKVLEPFHGARLAAYHNTWPYFARRFDLRIDLFLEPKPGIPPAPAHLAQAMAKMKEEKIRVVLLEPFQNRRTAEAVADGTGASVVSLTQYPGGVKGTEAGYVEMMDYIVQTLAKALAEKKN